jgi:Flp pilus assembly protein TadG
MMRKLWNSRQRAATTVSFALIAPVFLLIVFGTMEVGRVFNAWMVITNEAREAARYGAVTFDSTNTGATPAKVTAFLSQRLNGVLPPTYTSNVIVTSDSRPKVQVTIYYNVPLVVPVVSNVLPNPFPLAARSIMQGE